MCQSLLQGQAQSKGSRILAPCWRVSSVTVRDLPVFSVIALTHACLVTACLFPLSNRKLHSNRTRFSLPCSRLPFFLSSPPQTNTTSRHVHTAPPIFPSRVLSLNLSSSPLPLLFLVLFWSCQQRVFLPKVSPINFQVASLVLVFVSVSSQLTTDDLALPYLALPHPKASLCSTSI